MSIYILLEAAKSETGMRMLNYTGKMFWLMVFSTVFNAVSATSHTIAFQNDRSGFIILLGNIAVVYFFLSDTFIFHESFSTVEGVGTIIILCVVVGIAVSRAVTRYRLEPEHTKLN